MVLESEKETREPHILIIDGQDFKLLDRAIRHEEVSHGLRSFFIPYELLEH